MHTLAPSTGGLAMAVGYTQFVTPVGNLPPALNGMSFNAPFTCTATFAGDAGSNCAEGEYRQRVMGRFSVNGMTLAHILCGRTLLSPTQFSEDGCPPPTCSGYGHRACLQRPFDTYTPTRATGCEYASECSPGFRNVQGGDMYEIELTFQGLLVDVASGAALVTREWTIIGQVIAPTGAAPLIAPRGLQPDDQVAAVHALHNPDDDGHQIHVVVSRSPGAPPLDASALTLVLRDEGGEPIGLGDPIVHEVTSGGRATASIVYGCEGGARAHSAEVIADAANQVFQVVRR